MGSREATQYCHRFVNFETNDYQYPVEQIKAELDSYVFGVIEMDGPAAILYTKSQS
jgi:hypothetical protein